MPLVARNAHARINNTWVALLVAALALFGALASHAGAQEGDVNIAAPVQGDLLVAGRNVDVRGHIGGDLAVAGSQVSIAAPVDGYVMAAGADVTIGAAVGDDLWAAGRHVEVGAPVADNARLAGESVVVLPQADIGRDALIAGRRVEVRGPVERNLSISAAEALIAAEVGGSVQARTGSLRLLPGAVVRGDLVAYGPQPPEISPQARVLGQVKHHAPSDGAGMSPLGWLWQWLLGFAALLVLGIVAIAPSVRWSASVADMISRRFGMSLLAGIVALLVVPIAVALLAASVVGIPLAIVVFAFYIGVLLLSGVFVSLRIGTWLTARLGRPGASRYARLAAGALLLSFVAALPWVGWLAWLLVPLLGMGALLLERRAAWRAGAAAIAA